jgi:putative intracellular protease/amidase
MKHLCLLLSLMLFFVTATAQAGKGKILIIASNVQDMGDAGKHDARNNLWEFAPPYHVFVMHGYQVDFVSPKGGDVPFMLEPVGMMSYSIKYEGFYDKSRHSLPVSEVKAADYAAVYIGGGYGVMFDVANNPAMQQLIAAIYQQGGIVGSSGHGAAGFTNVKLNDGSYLVAGKKVAGFPDSTEQEKSWAKQGTLLPFLIETQLRKNGAFAINKENIADKTAVVVDQRIVSTMFLPSAALVAKEMLQQLEQDNTNNAP